MNQEGKWLFDTDAGKQEIICRHIGRDELHAIGLARAYVEAQRQFANQHSSVGGKPVYATRLETLPVFPKVDVSKPDVPQKILLQDSTTAPTNERKRLAGQPTYGYEFKILTRQGAAVPGGKRDYIDHGTLSRGFALVAYPSYWGKSGVMTFIINQDGKLYQRNLGPKTPAIAASMAAYSPSAEWTLVDEPGVQD